MITTIALGIVLWFALLYLIPVTIALIIYLFAWIFTGIAWIFEKITK